MLNEEALKMVGPSFEELDRNTKNLDTTIISLIIESAFATFTKVTI